MIPKVQYQIYNTFWFCVRATTFHLQRYFVWGKRKAQTKQKQDLSMQSQTTAIHLRHHDKLMCPSK